MSLRYPTARTLSRVAAAISVVLFACFVVLLVVASFDPDFTSTGDALGDAAIIVPFVGVGVVVTWKRPANLVGWALLLAGLGILLEGVLRAYAELRAAREARGGAARGRGGRRDRSWRLDCPHGRRLPAAHRLPVGNAVVPGDATIRRARAARLRGDLVHHRDEQRPRATAQGVRQPARADDERGATPPSASRLVVACLVSVVVAAVIVVRRFRRSRGDERQQFKWFATSAGFLVVTVPIATAFNWTGIGGIVITFQLIALPVSVGIAVLRYRLYEIDVIIRRTLVYGTLSALLAGTYVAVVIGLQALFSSFAGGSNLAIAVSTLAVAALVHAGALARAALRRPALLPPPLRRAAHARGLRRAAARAGRTRGRCAPTSAPSSRRRCSPRTSRCGCGSGRAMSARLAASPGGRGRHRCPGVVRRCVRPAHGLRGSPADVDLERARRLAIVRVRSRWRRVVVERPSNLVELRRWLLAGDGCCSADCSAPRDVALLAQAGAGTTGGSRGRARSRSVCGTALVVGGFVVLVTFPSRP